MFFISGFCGLLYQVVWMRMAMAEFGVISPITSVIVSVFMAGLGLGSWLGGKLANNFRERFGLSTILLYATCELIIAIGGFSVPTEFRFFGNLFLTREGNNSIFLLLSSLAITASILPWTIAMGATFPLVMGFIRERWPSYQSGFSFLYLANVLGAVLGAISTAYILIELNGFLDTLLIGSKLNILVILFSLLALTTKSSPESTSALSPISKTSFPAAKVLPFLFLSGFISMGIEIIWIRNFAGKLGSNVYGFAIILSTYLVSTFLGTLAYREIFVPKKLDPFHLISLAAPLTIIGMLCYDLPPAFSTLALGLSVIPISFLLGILTPASMDIYSSGDEKNAGYAYAINILGCIFGPLVASYIVLTLINEKWALLIFGLIFLLFTFFLRFRTAAISTFGFLALFLVSSLNPSYTENTYGPKFLEFNDYTANVATYGTGEMKQLSVNHVQMTKLTTITKMMVHIPLALQVKAPSSVLVICFGMGTSFKSAISWGAKSTAVELVPSVPKAFSFFHPNSEALHSPLANIIIDDGRRFLRRTDEKFDLITVDPPPPLDAAASGMLYSVEFYQEAKKHLGEKGLLQQWWYDTQDKWLFEAAIRTMKSVFPYVAAFSSVEGWGYHLVGSEYPIVVPDPKTAITRFPALALADLNEWLPGIPPELILARVFKTAKSASTFLREKEGAIITDNLPLNEYYRIRRGEYFSEK